MITNVEVRQRRQTLCRISTPTVATSGSHTVAYEDAYWTGTRKRKEASGGSCAQSLAKSYSSYDPEVRNLTIYRPERTHGVSGR